MLNLESKSLLKNIFGVMIMKHVVSNRDCNTINDFEISRDMLEHGKILAFADYDGAQSKPGDGNGKSVN